MLNIRSLALGAAALGAAALIGSTWNATASGGDARQPVDFWNYDSQTGEKVSNSSPGVAPEELALLYAPPSDASLVPDGDAGDPTGPHGEVDFWNYDPRTGGKTSNASPGVAPGELAELYGGRG